MGYSDIGNISHSIILSFSVFINIDRKNNNRVRIEFDFEIHFNTILLIDTR